MQDALGSRPCFQVKLLGGFVVWFFPTCAAHGCPCVSAGGWQSHRMVCVGRDIKDHPVPSPSHVCSKWCVWSHSCCLGQPFQGCWPRAIQLPPPCLFSSETFCLLTLGANEPSTQTSAKLICSVPGIFKSPFCFISLLILCKLLRLKRE